MTGVIASCLSLMVSGCGIGEPKPSSHATSAAPRLLATVNLTLPVERYLFSTAELNNLQVAQNHLVTDCMTGFGLTYKVPPPGPALGPRSLMDRRYGLTDEKTAVAFGYHLGKRDPRKQKPMTQSPPAGDALVALTGKSNKGEKSGLLVNGKSVPVGGCNRRSEEAIFGKSEAANDQFPQDLNVKSFFATKSSPDVTRTFHAWSSCMKERGFSYTDPLAAIDDKRFRGTDPSSAEIKVATADVACKKKTNLVGVWFSVETRFEKAAIRKNAARLNGDLARKKRALRVASDVIRKADD
ncbi:hypothetical protein GT028_30395 [Streptomyces sp. SID2999]|uniref:hypothetical protein n=1 Tax=Streptomyces sp. SID2999 TaxID=2690258 RepID=UPI001369C00E|nr:hypothetical protein [Streptomyces sp. SID2999]MYZ11635.1 hypothetical protein [Streptomyces sp. SID2999]